MIELDEKYNSVLIKPLEDTDWVMKGLSDIVNQVLKTYDFEKDEEDIDIKMTMEEYLESNRTRSRMASYRDLGKEWKSLNGNRFMTLTAGDIYDRDRRSEGMTEDMPDEVEFSFKDGGMTLELKKDGKVLARQRTGTDYDELIIDISVHLRKRISEPTTSRSLYVKISPGRDNMFVSSNRKFDDTLLYRTAKEKASAGQDTQETDSVPYPQGTEQ